jgi:hypothetical protein
MTKEARESTEQEVAAVGDAIHCEIQNLGYPAGMGMGPSGPSTEKIARAAIAAMASGWRPIDQNTPKDRLLLLCCGEHAPITGQWSREAGCFIGDNGCAYPFTHFADLFSPPESTK